MGKRYYWLKLKEDFFRQLPIKKLRRIAGGDTYTVIYLKMMLLTTKTEGVIGYDGATDEDFIENLALDIDEDENNVKITCNFLLANGLMLPYEDGMLLPEAKAATGSEQASAERVRQFRVREKAKALQCNTDVTPVKQIGNVEIEKEIELELEKDTTDVVVVSKDISKGSSYSPLDDVQKTLGIFPSSFQSECLKALYEEVGELFFHRALEKAAKANVKNIKYVETVARGLAAGDDFDEKSNTKPGSIDWDAMRKKYQEEEREN